MLAGNTVKVPITKPPSPSEPIAEGQDRKDMTVIWVTLDTTNTRKEGMVIEAIQEEPMEAALGTRAVTLMTQRTLPGEAQEVQEAQEVLEARVGPGDMETKGQAQLPAEALGTIMIHSLMD